jgi:PTS system nitrogen regulatory IIA component
LFAELLSVENVSASLVQTTKDAVLLELGELVSRSIEGATPQSVRKVLADREALASTGVGSGVAIPHGRLPGLDRVRVGIGVHQRGVGFDAIDGRPVHIFVVVISPDHEPGQHLRLLRHASLMLREEPVRRRFLACTDASSFYAAFVEEDARAR